MIDGLKIKITCDELKSHLFEKSSYHAKRAEDKQAELPAIIEAFEKIKAGGATSLTNLSHMNKASYGAKQEDVVEAMEGDIRDHRNKAMVFKFIGEHLFPEDYTLKEDDLFRLEILKRW